MSPRAGLDLHKILHTAGQLADEHGFDGVTLANLAQALGIRSPSIYNHVNGLQDLRNLMAVYALKMLQERLMRAAAGRSGDAAVLALGQAYLAFARNHPGLYEATLRAPNPEHEELVQISDELLQLFVQVMESFEVSGEEAVHTVRGLRSLLHGFASIERQGGFGLPVDSDVTLRHIMHTYLSGIHASRHASE